MNEDDDRLIKVKARVAPLSLDPLGVMELRAYIGELQAEITRAETEIGRKEGHRDAADAVFRRPQ